MKQNKQKNERRTLTRRQWIILICAALAAGIAAAVITVKLVKNRNKASYKELVSWDFENGAGDFYYDGYFSTSAFSIAEGEGVNGSRCAKIVSTEANDARFKIDLEVLPNTYYKVTARVRTEHVDSPNKSSGANISSFYSYEFGGGITGTTDWTDVTVYGLTSDRQTLVNLCFRLGFYSDDTSGTAWFDDIKVEQLTELPKGVRAVSFERSMLNSNSGSSASKATASQREIIARYGDTMKVGAIIVLAAFAVFAAMYRYARLRDRERELGISHDVTVWVPVEENIAELEQQIVDSGATRTDAGSKGGFESAAEGAAEEAEEELSLDELIARAQAEDALKAQAGETSDSEEAAENGEQGEVISLGSGEKPLFRPRKIGYKGVSVLTAVIIMLVLGLILRLVLSLTAPQCGIDVGLFQSWGRHAVEDGITNIYAKAATYNLDYPPLYIYFLWFNTLIGRLLGIADSGAMALLTKLPAMLADIVIGWIIYRLTENRFSKNWVIFLVCLWVFNPMVLLDSACWGQVDALLALPCLLMVYFITRDKYIPASVMLGLAIILKPQGIFVVPILGYALVRKFFRDRETPKLRTLMLALRSILVCFATIFLVALPCGIKMKPNFFSWLINLYIGTAGGYKGATVNSYNFWYVLGKNWTNDAEPFGGLTYFRWGMIFIVIACLIAWAMYQIPKKQERWAPFMIAGTMVCTVTMFAPRMHERYFFPSVALLLAAVVLSNNKILLYLYGLLTGVNFLSVLSIMMGLEVGGALRNANAQYDVYAAYYWAGPALHRELIAWVNLICCLALLAVSVLLAFGVLKADSPKLQFARPVPGNSMETGENVTISVNNKGGSEEIRK